jgi:hypothetical protein
MRVMAFLSCGDRPLMKPGHYGLAPRPAETLENRRFLLLAGREA